MAYRSFNTETWKDPWFECLSPQAKLLFIYLWTNDTCNQAGVYQISLKRIEFDVGFPAKEILRELHPKVKWFPEFNIIWVKNFFKYQCANEKFAIGAIKSIENFPKEIKVQFITYNQKLIERYGIEPKKYGIDTLSIPYAKGMDRVSNGYAYPTDTHPISDTGSDTDTGSDIDKPPSEVAQSDKNRSEPPAEKPLFEVPLVGSKNKHKQVFPIYQEDINTWQKLYPGVDVENEIRKLVGWNIANPTRRKTPRGITRHINSWLAKAQDAGNGHRIRAPDISPESERAWDVIMNCFRTGEYNIRDPVILKAIEHMGGIRSMRLWSKDEMAFRRKEFISLYGKLARESEDETNT